jgi:hypothetical protein
MSVKEEGSSIKAEASLCYIAARFAKTGQKTLSLHPDRLADHRRCH